MQKLRHMREDLREEKEKLKDKIRNRANTFKVWKMTDEQLDQYFTKKYLDEIESHFKTGDIILSRAGHAFFSQVVRKGTMSTWAHIAMIVVDPSPAVREAYKMDEYYHEDLKERVFIFESKVKTKDNRPGGGTQMYPFKRWLKCCIDEFTDSFLAVWRSLKHPEPNDKHYHEVFFDFEKFMLDMCKKSYEHSRVQLCFSGFNSNGKEDLSTIFCSELIAAALKSMQLLPESTNSSNFSPRDFTSNQRIDGADVKLMNGYCYEKEVRIRMRPSIYNAISNLSDTDFLPASSIPDRNLHE